MIQQPPLNKYEERLRIATDIQTAKFYLFGFFLGKIEIMCQYSSKWWRDKGESYHL